MLNDKINYSISINNNNNHNNNEREIEKLFNYRYSRNINQEDNHNNKHLLNNDNQNIVQNTDSKYIMSNCSIYNKQDNINRNSYKNESIKIYNNMLSLGVLKETVYNCNSNNIENCLFYYKKQKCYKNDINDLFNIVSNNKFNNQTSISSKSSNEDTSSELTNKSLLTLNPNSKSTIIKDIKELEVKLSNETNYKNNTTNYNHSISLIKLENRALEDYDIIIKSLKKHFFLKNLSEENMKEVIKEMFLINIKPQTTVVTQGSIGIFFYIVKDGELDVLINSESVHILKKGSSFGELAILQNSVRTSSVKTINNCLCWCLDRRKVRKIVDYINSTNFEESKLFIINHSIFSNITNDMLSIVSSNLLKIYIEPDEFIIRKGDTSKCIYFIKQGIINIYKDIEKCCDKKITKYNTCSKDISNNKLLIKSLSKGDYFGEVSILLNKNRTMHAISKTKCIIYCITKETLISMLGNNYINKLTICIIKECFRKSKYFSNINLDLINNTINCFSIKRYTNNELVFKKGDTINNIICIVIEGELIDETSRNIIAKKFDILNEESIVKYNKLHNTNNEEKSQNINKHNSLVSSFMSSNNSTLVNNVCINNICSGYDSIIALANTDCFLKMLGIDSFENILNKYFIVNTLKKIHLFKYFEDEKIKKLSELFVYEKITSNKSFDYYSNNNSKYSSGNISNNYKININSNVINFNNNLNIQTIDDAKINSNLGNKKDHLFLFNVDNNNSCNNSMSKISIIKDCSNLTTPIVDINNKSKDSKLFLNNKYVESYVEDKNINNNVISKQLTDNENSIINNCLINSSNQICKTNYVNNLNLNSSNINNINNDNKELNNYNVIDNKKLILYNDNNSICDKIISTNNLINKSYTSKSLLNLNKSSIVSQNDLIVESNNTNINDSDIEIIKQGQRNDYFYIIKSGKIKVFKDMKEIKTNNNFNLYFNDYAFLFPENACDYTVVIDSEEIELFKIKNNELVYIENDNSNSSNDINKKYSTDSLIKLTNKLTNYVKPNTLNINNCVNTVSISSNNLYKINNLPHHNDKNKSNSNIHSKTSFFSENMLIYLRKKYLYDSLKPRFTDLIYLKQLGDSSIGIVSLVKSKFSHLYFICKNISKFRIIEEKSQELISQESKLSTKLDHPFISKNIDTVQTNYHVVFIKEYVNGCELFIAMNEIGLFNKTTSQFYFASMLSAINYMHNLKIIYRDVKPENVIISQNVG